MPSNAASMIVLFGAPTVGKDTVTHLLTAQTDKFEHFKKLKLGKGSRHGYTMITDVELSALRAEGRVLSEVERYGSTYVIERQELEQTISRGVVPVVHSASIAETQLLHQLGAVVVLLECSAETARGRLMHRDALTVDERMEVFEAVNQQLDVLIPVAAGRLSSDKCTASELADAIKSLVLGSGTTDSE